jgi:O-acetyl-ADP-ribose deacetylase (regulator of RNase III)
VITTAGNLPSDFVIHTVGPVWRGGGTEEAERLSECYRNALSLAVENACKSVAFPNISTGIYGFPKDKAAKIAVETVKDFVKTNKSIEKVVFVCFDQENY